jgi:hypothetical protein
LIAVALPTTHEGINLDGMALTTVRLFRYQIHHDSSNIELSSQTTSIIVNPHNSPSNTIHNIKFLDDTDILVVATEEGLSPPFAQSDPL